MSAVLDIFLPAQCLFCNRVASRVCTDCEQAVGSDPRLVYRNGLIGFAASDYSENAKKLLRSYKELGESELSKVIARSMVSLLSCFEHPPTVLVPIPSNAASVRDRGFNPAERIAKEICRLSPGLRSLNLLNRSRETLDQSKLAPRQRQINQRNSMTAIGSKATVVLIDDVVTTGSTLLEASNALTNAGNFVQGFITFAETESKRCNLSSQAQLPEDGGTSWN